MLTDAIREKTPTLDPHRKQILEDMGIEVWRRRSAAPKPAPAQPSAHTAAAAGPQPRRGTPAREGPQRQRQPASTPTNAPKRPAAAAGARLERPPPAAATPTDEAFALTATCAQGVLVATSAFANRKQAALAADIARCAGRDWSADLKQLRFDWPLPGITGAAAPALCAFLDKQMQDFAVQRPLVTASMARKIPPDAFDCIAIPDLEQLEDADAKRELWRRLQGRN